MKKVSVLLICLFCFTSCFQMLNEATDAIINNQSEVETTESLSTGSYKTITIDSLYQLDVPKYMRSMDNLHPEASLKYASIYKEAYSIVLHENKQDFIDIYEFYEGYHKDVSVIENYEVIQRELFNETIKGARVQSYGLVHINNHPARQIKMIGNVDGTDIYYLVTFIEGNDNIFMIMSWTLKERKDILENTFEYINGTFKLL